MEPIVGLAYGRIAVGALSLLSPSLTARLFLLDPKANPQLSYMGRMFGSREVVLGALTLASSGRWEVEQRAELEKAPYTACRCDDDTLFIVTTDQLIRYSPKQNRSEVLLEDGFWMGDRVRRGEYRAFRTPHGRAWQWRLQHMSRPGVGRGSERPDHHG